MKDLKKLKSETSEILNNIKDIHHDEFTRVNEYQKNLEKYYIDNSNNYDKDTLLQMYKHISKEKKLLFDNLNAIISGIIGGFVVEIIKDFDNFSKGLISVGVIVIFFIIIALLIIKYIFSIPKNDPSFKSYFFDKIHANILKKQLEEQGFCLFRGDSI